LLTETMFSLQSAEWTIHHPQRFEYGGQSPILPFTLQSTHAQSGAPLQQKGYGKQYETPSQHAILITL